MRKIFYVFCTLFLVSINASAYTDHTSSNSTNVTYSPKYFKSNRFGFNNPSGIAVDSKENVWVVNYGGSSFLKNFSTISSVTKIPFGDLRVPPHIYTGPQNPYYNNKYAFQIVTDRKGNTWVADIFNYTLTEYPADAANKPIIYFGEKYNLRGMVAITADPNSNIWILNAAKRNLTKIPADDLNSPIIYYSPAYQFSYPTAITSDPEGNIWVVNEPAPGQTTESIVKIPANNPNAPITYSGMNYQFWGISDIASDNQGNIWVASTLNGMYLSLTKIPFDTPTNPKVYSSDEPVYIGDPKIATDPEGNVWIDNFIYGTEVMEFPQSNPSMPIKVDPYPVSQNGYFNSLTSDKFGNIWITDKINNSVVELVKTKK